MDNHNQSSEGKTKNITFGLVFSWLFGIIVGIAAIHMLFTGSAGIGLLLLATALIIFPPTDKVIKNKLHIALSRGLKIAIVIIVLIIAGVSLMKSDPASGAVSNKPTDVSPEPKAETIKITAPKLVALYIANEVSADLQFKGKMLEISGTVHDIGKDILNNPYVVLDGNPSDYFTNVQCMFDKSREDQLANLKKDMQLTLQGVNSGKLGNVLINDCTIVQ